VLDAQLLARSPPPLNDVAPQVAVSGFDQRARLVFQCEFFDGIDVCEIHGVGVEGDVQSMGRARAQGRSDAHKQQPWIPGKLTTDLRVQTV
jgi:hypothetical protein